MLLKLFIFNDWSISHFISKFSKNLLYNLIIKCKKIKEVNLPSLSIVCNSIINETIAEFIYPEFQKVALAHSAAAQLDCTEAAEWASATF